MLAVKISLHSWGHACHLLGEHAPLLSCRFSRRSLIQFSGCTDEMEWPVVLE